MAFNLLSMLTMSLMVGTLNAVTDVHQDPVLVLADRVVENVPAGRADEALKYFVAYSETRNLDIHLGEEKGGLLETAVQQGLPQSGVPVVIFEAGCHAGDGTLNVVTALKGRQGTIVSTEENPAYLEAARRVVMHAISGMQLSFLPSALDARGNLDTFLDTLRDKRGITRFDAVVLDHDEKLFSKHLESILARDFLRLGGTIFIDNVNKNAAQLASYMQSVTTGSGKSLQIQVKKLSDGDAIAVATLVEPTSNL